MDTTAVLESMVRVFDDLPSIEDQLVVFDALLNVSDDGQRPAAAEMLRNAASSARVPARRERLLKAAEDVAAGRPCALTPDGLSASQAAAAAQSTEPSVNWVDAAVSTEDEEDDFMDEAPPKMPHLRVADFFPGLVIRVAQRFIDAQGRAFCGGELLNVLSVEPQGVGGYLLNLRIRTLRLDGKVHGVIIENEGNGWLQPAPSLECLDELCDAIDLELDKADERLEDDDDIEHAETLRGDIEACWEWIQAGGERAKAPKLESGGLAAQVFGRGHRVIAWVRLLYAGVSAR